MCQAPGLDIVGYLRVRQWLQQEVRRRRAKDDAQAWLQGQREADGDR
jgi:hypothetical protein